MAENIGQDNLLKKIPVHLVITGTQKDIGGEPVVQKLQGLLSRRGDSSYIQYTEDEGIPGIMKLTSSRVEIKRGGTGGPLLFFEKDAICRTFYDTPSGMLEAEFRTAEVDIKTENQETDRLNYHVSVKYLLLMNGERVSECELDIRIWN